VRPPRQPTSPTRLLERQRRAAEALRRELLGSRATLDRPYVDAFDRRLRDYRVCATRSEIERVAATADVVYVGDFHAVPAYQQYTAGLLERLARRRAPLTLGIEFVYTRQQRLLDQRQQGALQDDEFRRRIHYDEEWGYPWEGFRDLLDRAASLGVEVRALDAPPRGGKGALRRRDEHAARRIADCLTRREGCVMLVLIGETHLLPDRLPLCVDRRLARAGLSYSSAVVFQNPDRIYWRALERESSLPEAVRIDDRRYAVLHTGPLEKYEAYRQVLERWSDEVPSDDELDLTPSVHHLIRLLLRETGMRVGGRRVKLRAGWTEELADVFPEVYSGPHATRLLEPMLDEHGRSDQERGEARRDFRTHGAVYDPRPNAIFVSGYLPGPAAGEGARFLRAALTGGLFATAEELVDRPVDATYEAAYTEALAFLGSRLVDPTTDYLAGPPDREVLDPALRREVAAHRRSVESTSALSPSLVAVIERSTPLRRAIARDLGRRLGASLFDRASTGDLSRAEIRELFGRRFVPGRTRDNVLRLLAAAGTDARSPV
jgi:hypothetical protein